MAVCISSKSMTLHHWLHKCSSSVGSVSAAVAVAVAWKKGKTKKLCLLPVNCTPLEQNPKTEQEHMTEEEEEEEFRILCEPCNGRGWLLCDFCKGKKNNVKAENNRIYRRCPTCKAVGYVLCSKCKVFKCITFPDYSDGKLTA
ncbi:unnamed protein product [Musa acuminata subsp. malaccensis]|uniref:(wild Malaysian banana) hypothetical protein n=1 Tax=Musa acuminata subsp. malaccensis TaxID=214687 RepID=A0A804KJ73_MUSAM|nr:PREDICTED: uncharacterized protein LOC103997898 [Musa acuminata subsp. malaccensis]XP_018686985.1 PREDICTED: uncharacterized protein LOC103997898 [Musa acuminata subsp. malaccensis]CAG1835081.1 unnamed protein product [Musa acuminata subsp. malaccensis]